MTQTGKHSSAEIYNAVVTHSVTVYSTEIENHDNESIRIASEIGGTLAGTFYFQSWDGVLNKWITEPLATFTAQPAGAPADLVDTFKTTRAEKYRVKLVTSGGAGLWKASWTR